MARVILVEDEKLISTMVVLNLKRAGYDVAAFDQAEPMLEHLAGHEADVILLDIMLPGMQGDEALRRIRAMGLKVPVLMLTARRELETKVTALDSGADDYVTKPFDMNELLARVRAAIRRSAGPG
jgi:DNA-binding response OmpR family regulator